MNTRQKNLVTLLTVTVVAGGLGLYAYLGVLEPERQEEERKEAEEHVFPIHAPGERAEEGQPPALQFTTLSLELVEPVPAKLELEFRDGAWRVTSPEPAMADKGAVDNLLHQLVTSRFNETIEESPTEEDLARYGLKPPRAILTARAFVPDDQGGGKDDPARQRTVTLHAGIENTFDGSVYVRREGDPRVYSADGALRYALVERSPSDWRDRELFPLADPPPQRIEVKARKNAYVLERDANKTWRLVQPVAMPAEAQSVDNLLTTLKSYRAISFPSKELEAQLLATLEKPMVDARFTTGSGEPVRVRLSELQVGGMPRVYALREKGSDTLLAEVDTAALVVLDQRPSDFKDKTALSFKRDEVWQIRIYPAPGDTPILLMKAPDTERWEVVAPLPGRAKEFKVASLLGALDRLRAAALGEPAPKRWEKYGITPTSRGVALLGQDGKELARLSLGSEVEGNTGRLWARGSASEVLELDKAAYEALPLRLSDLMEGAQADTRAP